MNVTDIDLIFDNFLLRKLSILGAVIEQVR